MNELHLFAGAGGGILGGLLLGHRPICAVELDPYCRDVLLQRQRDVALPWFPVWDDVRTFDGRPWRGIADVVCGGFPCQDISVAGKGAGITGERSGLWAEMARVIREVQPRFAFVENSPALTGRGLGVVLGDLAAMGFDARWGVVSAQDSAWLAGNPAVYHERERIWILAKRADNNGECRREGRTRGFAGNDSRIQVHETAAYESRGENANSPRILERRQEQRTLGERIGESGESGGGSIENANANEKRFPRDGTGRPVTAFAMSECSGKSSNANIPRTSPSRNYCGVGRFRQQISSGTRGDDIGWWQSEPALGRVAHGVANRVDRLKAIGNGQVPQVAALAWRILIEQFSKTS